MKKLTVSDFFEGVSPDDVTVEDLRTFCKETGLPANVCKVGRSKVDIINMITGEMEREDDINEVKQAAAEQPVADEEFPDVMGSGSDAPATQATGGAATLNEERGATPSQPTIDRRSTQPLADIRPDREVLPRPEEIPDEERRESGRNERVIESDDGSEDHGSNYMNGRQRKIQFDKGKFADDMERNNEEAMKTTWHEGRVAGALKSKKRKARN